MDESNLICPQCSETYDDPRLLPCGENLCNECIRDLIRAHNGNALNCPYCKSVHSFPASNSGSGFPPNKFITRFMSKQARASGEERSSEHAIENLRKLLKLLQKKLADVRCDEASLSRLINSHTSAIRAQVDEACEMQTSCIEAYRERLIKAIDTYELEAMVELRRNNKPLVTTEQLVVESVGGGCEQASLFESVRAFGEQSCLFESYARKLLTRDECVIGEYVVKEMSDEAHECLDGVERARGELMRILFGNRRMRFEVGLKPVDLSECLGKLTFGEFSNGCNGIDWAKKGDDDNENDDDDGERYCLDLKRCLSPSRRQQGKECLAKAIGSTGKKGGK